DGKHLKRRGGRRRTSMIYAVGETLIDMIFDQMRPTGAKVGGSAVNSAVSLGRFGDFLSLLVKKNFLQV
ncbi:MAG: hypothetical protein II032_02490, partial [Treponema sp.]|nr:hypothetical protein [Treponema sp.]